MDLTWTLLAAGFDPNAAMAVLAAVLIAVAVFVVAGALGRSDARTRDAGRSV